MFSPDDCFPESRAALAAATRSQLVFYRRIAIAAEARLAAQVSTPIVTMDGRAVHIVSLIDHDGEALTRCGLRIGRALSLIDAARALHGAEDCKSCRRYLRANP